jgi:2-polyprenyl-3-methyl-5-hydroxy-6-metoxy-1,4-benzoquinol methylase
MPTVDYIGNELDLFAHATNWKRYWTDLIAPLLGRNVLDVGAGIGATAAALGSQAFDRYVALEPDRSNVARMREAADAGAYSHNFEAIAGTLHDLPSGSAFDTILYIDVLEHIEHDRDELRRAAGHLSPGGRVIVLSPAHQWLYSPFDRAVGHFRRYDKASLLEAARGTLVPGRILYLDSVGLLASAANRLVLGSSQPTLRQIMLWDGVMVRASRHVHRAVGFRWGKSILASFIKPDDDA